jgi:hypothetical protein
MHSKAIANRQAKVWLQSLQFTIALASHNMREKILQENFIEWNH